MATKKAAPKKTSKSSPKKAVHKKTGAKRHFRLTRETEPFFTFRISRETLHWLILSVVVIAFTLWVVRLESEIVDAYDQIDANRESINDNSESIQRNRNRINNLMQTSQN